jgi:adenosylcobinamide kinase / adenosylcobinamide-phosphate guanylyltransferase
MALTLLLGGARSGKSVLAVRTAEEWGGAVLFVATGTAGDDEMAVRIERHRAERPTGWTTVEEPENLLSVLREAPVDALVLVDCLSLWVANLLEAGWEDDALEAEAAEAAGLAGRRKAPTVVVSNEVGLGIVPATPLGRRYRDLLGRVNAIFASHADDAILVIAGRKVRLET